MTKSAVLLILFVFIGIAVIVWLTRRNKIPPIRVTQTQSIPVEAISSKINVKYGKSVTLEGNAIGVGELLFAPAIIRLEGNQFDSTNPFSEYASKQPVSTTLADAIDRGCDAVWIKGRLLKAFSIRLVKTDDGCEKSFNDRAFAALITNKDGTFDAIPFFCRDYYGDSELIFSQHPPSEELSARIASEFWSLLLNDQAAVQDYADKFYHPGGGATFRFGIKSGNIFIDDAWNDLAKKRKN